MDKDLKGIDSQHKDESSKEKIVDIKLDFEPVISNTYRENMARLSKTAGKVVSAYIDTYDISHSLINVFQESVKPLIETCKSINEMMSDWYSNYGKMIAELLADLKIHSYSEEEIQHIRENFERWGSFGWTVLPDADINYFYYTVPEDRKEANRLALQYCKKDNIDYIFDQISKSNNFRKDDVEEAIFDFNNKKYKSCAMMLFSMIEAFFIRRQGIKPGENKKIGAVAGKRALDRAIDGKEERAALFTIFMYSNILSCSAKLFESGKNFVCQPEIINRNFLNHGLLNARVKRMDCIQLFLLLYNVMELFDTLRDI